MGEGGHIERNKLGGVARLREWRRDKEQSGPREGEDELKDEKRRYGLEEGVRVEEGMEEGDRWKELGEGEEGYSRR